MSEYEDRDLGFEGNEMFQKGWTCGSQHQRRAIRDALRDARERGLREVEDGYSWDPALIWDDIISWFEEGGRFEVEEGGDVPNPPQSRTSVEESLQVEEDA